MPDETPDEVPGPPAPNPVPFVVAVAVVVLVVVLAYVFLWEEEPGELVHPDRLTVVDDDTIRAVAFDRSACERIVRAQVSLGDDEILVELVVEDDGDCVDVVERLEAEVTLPEPVDGRDVRPGTGRIQILCSEPAASVTCGSDR